MRPKFTSDIVIRMPINEGEEVFNKEIKVMDMTAFTLCKENNVPIIVFNMNEPGNLKKVVLGDEVGTLVEM